VVINDFHIFHPRIRPTKANPPLVVDTNALLTRTLALERFKMIAGWYSQIIKSGGDFKLSKLAPCHLSHVYEPPDGAAF
jgi:hypothetical protein